MRVPETETSPLGTTDRGARPAGRPGVIASGHRPGRPPGCRGSDAIGGLRHARVFCTKPTVLRQRTRVLGRIDRSHCVDPGARPRRGVIAPRSHAHASVGPPVDLPPFRGRSRHTRRSPHRRCDPACPGWVMEEGTAPEHGHGLRRRFGGRAWYGAAAARHGRASARRIKIEGQRKRPVIWRSPTGPFEGLKAPEKPTRKSRQGCPLGRVFSGSVPPGVHRPSHHYGPGRMISR